MSYREKIAIGQTRRQIALATHLNSPIANETCSHEVPNSPARRAAEEKLAKIYTQRRPPTAGYNCFGHAFALRRTAIFDCKNPDIDRILSEDGYAPVSDEEAASGDVVLYSDEDGYTHAARIDRCEHALVLSGSLNASSLVPIVLSKFDEFSGEYEHKIDDARWSTGIVGNLTRVIYRDRHAVPRPAAGGGWRAIVAAPSAP